MDTIKNKHALSEGDKNFFIIFPLRYDVL